MTTGLATSAIWSRSGERFQVFDGGDVYRCRDWLRPGERQLAKAGASPWGSRELGLELLRQAVGTACESTIPLPVADRPRDRGDWMFWQFPCRTEAAACAVHAVVGLPVVSGGEMHCYLGLPWATWIDKERAEAQQPSVRRQLELLRVRVSGLRQALRSMGAGLRLHTVCQHVYWRRMLAAARRVGVTDLWLSHAPDLDEITVGAEAALLRIHPWHLYAVNVLDPARRAGIVVGKDPAEKGLLASFMGTHLPHYISEARLRLGSLVGEPGFAIEVTGERWHFEDVVYRHQVHHEPLQTSYRVGDDVARYNAMLSDSVFALCPAGAGPNTLRLWEALAVGSIPVLLGPAPRLPMGGTLPRIDWESIVLRVDEAAIADLPRLLRALSIEECRKRQRLGLQAFAAVRSQRCV